MVKNFLSMLLWQGTVNQLPGCLEVYLFNDNEANIRICRRRRGLVFFNFFLDLYDFFRFFSSFVFIELFKFITFLFLSFFLLLLLNRVTNEYQKCPQNAKKLENLVFLPKKRPKKKPQSKAETFLQFTI